MTVTEQNVVISESYNDLAPEHREPPPPYSPPAYDIPNSLVNPYSLQMQQQTQALGGFPLTLPSVASLDILNQILSSPQQFIFHSMNDIQLNGEETVVQLRDAHERTVFLTMRTIVSGQTRVSRRQMIVRDMETKILDPTGRILIYAKRKYGQTAMTVMTGSQVLAIVEGIYIRSGEYVAKNTLGRAVFHVGTKPNFIPSGMDRRGRRPFDWNEPSCYFHLFNGQIIAKLTRSKTADHQDIVSLHISQDLDRILKGAVIACAHAIYINYYAPTRHGRGGVKKALKWQIGKRDAMLMTFFIAVVVAIILLITFHGF